MTCIDCRLDPAAAFGIKLGDARVIRKAGGSAIEALRSIIISEQLLGTTSIFVIKHTGCGMVGKTGKDLFSNTAKNLGKDAVKELDDKAKEALETDTLNELLHQNS